MRSGLFGCRLLALVDGSRGPGRPDIEEILSWFNQVRNNGVNSWMAECPCHEDRNPSLHLTWKEDGTVLVYCHGCRAKVKDVAAAIGQPTAKFFPISENQRSTPSSSSGLELRATYTYEDSEGVPVMQQLRYVDGYGVKTFRSKKWESGQWLPGAPPPENRPLYNLPEVLRQVEAGGEVWVVEGEKDVETLRKKGIVATTCPFGAGKWLPHHTDCLAGASVVIIRDIDEAGLAHALQVAEALRVQGATVEVLQASVGTDISDHIAAGLSRSDLQQVPEAIKDDFTDFQRLLAEFDPTLPEHIRFEMAGKALREWQPTNSDDDEVRERLQSWRLGKAQELGVPVYQIFWNRTLDELVARRPTNHSELLEVWGLGAFKVESYGDEILDVLWRAGPG